jgi:hypothetical protein
MVDTINRALDKPGFLAVHAREAVEPTIPVFSKWTGGIALNWLIGTDPEAPRLESALSATGAFIDSFGLATIFASGPAAIRSVAGGGALEIGMLRFKLSPMQGVYNARSSSMVTKSILEEIDPRRFNPAGRFGGAFYVSEGGETTVLELAARQSKASHVIRYKADLSSAKVLDLTSTKVARTWNYVEDVNGYSAHQDLAKRAMAEGYNVIKFKSYRGPGANYAILDNPINPFDFNQYLKPQMVSPVR